MESCFAALVVPSLVFLDSFVERKSLMVWKA